MTQLPQNFHSSDRDQKTIDDIEESLRLINQVKEELYDSQEMGRWHKLTKSISILLERQINLYDENQ